MGRPVYSLQLMPEYEEEKKLLITLISLGRPRFNPIDGLGCCPRVNSGQGVIFRSSKVGLEALIEGPIFG